MLNEPLELVTPLVRVGVLPSKVYRSVVPLGMLTCAVNGAVNTQASLSMTGALNCSEAKELPLLLAPGVGVDVIPHAPVPSVVRA